MINHTGTTMNMTCHSTNPRVLIVSPEITCLHGMGDPVSVYECKARRHGLADLSATLINALYEQGADVHVAIPDYRHIFNVHLKTAVEESLYFFGSYVPNDRIHLARDKALLNLSQNFQAAERTILKFRWPFNVRS